MTKDELRAWREARGLTQAQLGEALGYSRQSVIAWEKGRAAIPDNLLVTIEAAHPSPVKTAAAPAITADKRWRPFPWGNRDYHIDKEVYRLQAGTKVWRLHADASEWEVMICSKKNAFHRSEPHITMPAEAFPDPMGIEAAWAREMFNSRMAAYNADRAGLRQAMRDAGIPPEE